MSSTGALSLERLGQNLPVKKGELWFDELVLCEIKRITTFLKEEIVTPLQREKERIL